MTNKYILGGGIAGLIAAHYNPDYTIITPEVGGQLAKSKKLLMTFFIHNHILTKQLLEDLEIPYKERQIKIYYNYKGQILKEINNKQRLKFISNKICEHDYDKNSSNIVDTNLSTQDNFLDVLDTDISLLLKKLKPTKMINGKIKLINNNRKFMVYLDEKNNLIKANYNKLISTIPANDFFYTLYNFNSNYNFRYLPATFVLSSKRPEFMKENGLYYIYDSNLIYTRVQNYSDNYVYEITGFCDAKEIAKHIEDILEIEHRYVGILFKEDVDDLKNIKFLGRMAQWDHSIKTQQVIEKAKEIFKNEM